MADNEKNYKINIDTNANDATKQIDGVFGSIKKGFDTLKKNPYLAVIGVLIGGIVAAFNKLKNAIKGSDDAGTSFARLLNILKAPLQVVNKLFDSLANSLGKVADSMADTLKNIMPERWREQAEAEDELVVATDRLEEAERDYALNHAKREAEIADLRNKSVQADKYTTQERIKYIMDAMRIEQQDVRERKKNLDEKIRLFEVEHRNEKSWSDEVKNAYNQLKIEKINADREVLQSQRKLNSQLQPLVNDLITQAGDLSSSYGDIVKSIREIYAETTKLKIQEDLKNSADAIEKVRDNFEEMTKTLSDDNYDEAKEALEDLIGGYGKHTIEGAKKAVESIQKLRDIIGDNTFITEAQRQLNQINVSIKEVEEVQDKAIKAANKARQESIDNVTATIANETKKVQEENSSLIQKLGDDTVVYFQNIANIRAKLAEVEIKKEKTQSKELRKEYEKQIALLNRQLVALSTNFVNTMSSNIGESSTVISDTIEKVEQNTEMAAAAMADFSQMAEGELNTIQEIGTSIYKFTQDNVDNINAVIDTMGTMSGVMGELANYYGQQYDKIIAKGEEMTESDKKRAKEYAEQQYQATLAQIGLNEAMSIGNALLAATSAAAQSGVAAPIVFAATLTTLLAGVISTILQANQAAQQMQSQIAKLNSYATGGYIQGAGSSTSDSIPARLSNGEAVINARSTARFYDLLSAINQAGGGVAFPNANNMPIMRYASGGVVTSYDSVVGAIRSAVNDIQPVVSVKEITRVQNRVLTKEIL